MLKREWSMESNGKLPQLIILSKTATLVPECEVEDQPLDGAAGMIPEFAIRDLPLGRTLDNKGRRVIGISGSLI